MSQGKNSVAAEEEHDGRGLVQLSGRQKTFLLELSRKALRQHLSQQWPDTPVPGEAALLEPRAVFVTLRRWDGGELRGCRGEILPHKPLYQAVVETSVASAVADPRFKPVTLQELAKIRIGISVLSEPAPLRPDQIEIGRHGLILNVAGRSGLLLPEVARSAGWDRQEFLEALCRKAYLPAGAWRSEGAELRGFETVSFKESRKPGWKRR